MCTRQALNSRVHKMKRNSEEDVPVSPKALCFQWNASKHAAAPWGYLENLQVVLNWSFTPNVCPQAPLYFVVEHNSNQVRTKGKLSLMSLKV